MVSKPKRKSAIVSLSMPPEMLERIDSSITSRYPNRSAVVRELIQQWFDDLDGVKSLPLGRVNKDE